LKTVEVYIPGKIMLAGEYAVLRGGHSLAATVSCGMTVEASWDPKAASWSIESDIWSEPRVVADDHTPQTDILCRAVQFAARKTSLHGGTLRVSSEIAIKDGIGSSSALRLGVCAAFLALRDHLNPSLSQEAAQSAWQLQCEGQGVASGYDIICQQQGGLVEFSFEYENNKWKPRWFKHDLEASNQIVHIFTGGNGAPTTPTIQTTSSWLEGANRFERLIDASETLVDMLNQAIKWPDAISLRRLYAACGTVRQLFAGNPTFPTAVAERLAEVPGMDSDWSWKTTGAGGEDAIILLGTNLQISAAAQALESLGWHKAAFHLANVGMMIKIQDNSETPGREPSTRSSRSAMREFLG
jgi:hypothetical protein